MQPPKPLALDLPGRFELLLGAWPLVAIALFLWAFLIPLELAGLAH